MTGLMERTALIREGLKALIERESARRLSLARLGGSEPQAKPIPRRRSEPACDPRRYLRLDRPPAGGAANGGRCPPYLIFCSPDGT